MPSARRIQLIRTPQEVFNPYTSLSLRFTVEATNGYLMDNNVFKMMRAPLDPNNPDSDRDIFLGVCSPAELSALPVDDPDDEDATSHFRVDFMDLVYETEILAKEAWELIQDGVTDLKEALDASDTLGTAETVWIGTPP